MHTSHSMLIWRPRRPRNNRILPQPLYLGQLLNVILEHSISLVSGRNSDALANL